jgi:hypothetical protein
MFYSIMPKQQEFIKKYKVFLILLTSVKMRLELNRNGSILCVNTERPIAAYDVEDKFMFPGNS